jgi:hypothetical protein
MLNFDNQQEIESALDLAERDINQLKPDLALERLGRIGRQINDADPYERAYYSLLLGQAFAAMRNPGAETYLLEAEDRVKALPVKNRELQLQELVRDQRLEFKVYKQLGKFYTSVVKKPSKAKECFSQAKASALALGVSEDTADIELRIKAIDLTIDKDPELKNFQKLRHVAGENYIASDQLAAWRRHHENSQSPTLLYARKGNVRDEQYFLNLLESVKDRR